MGEARGSTARLTGAHVDDALVLAHRSAAAFANSAGAYGDNSAERHVTGKLGEVAAAPPATIHMSWRSFPVCHTSTRRHTFSDLPDGTGAVRPGAPAAHRGQRRPAITELLANKQALFDEFARVSDMAKSTPDAVDLSEADLVREVIAAEQRRLSATASAKS